MTRIGTEGYDEFVQVQNEKRKLEKPKRITLGEKRIRLYCACTSSAELPWVDACNKGMVLLPSLGLCEKCKYYPWTFTKSKQERGLKKCLTYHKKNDLV
jgi:hypothetical protein